MADRYGPDTELFLHQPSSIFSKEELFHASACWGWVSQHGLSVDFARPNKFRVSKICRQDSHMEEKQQVGISMFLFQDSTKTLNTIEHV